MTPNFQRMLEIGKQFEALGEQEVDMGNSGRVFPDCGTPGCVAGYWDLLNNNPDKFIVGGGFSFNAAAVHLSKELGFRNPQEFNIWVAQNFELWGLDAAETDYFRTLSMIEVFIEPKTWGETKGTINTLKIGHRLIGCAERGLKQLEAKK